jgi:hypothetical protein
MTARKLSPTGEAAVRRAYPDDPEKGEEMIRRINEWQPKPPLHAPGQLARCTPEIEAKLAKTLGPEEAHIRAERINAWVDQREQQKREGKHSTLFRAWTPERLESARRNNAERQRRYRERQRLARLALQEMAHEFDQPA